MIKRIVLEHANGLRQICGILDIPETFEFDRQMLHNRLAYGLETNGKRHVVYKELTSLAATTEGQAAKTPENL